MVRFLKDIHDPHYVGNLYNINRPKGSPPVQLGQSEKHHFGTFACKQVQISVEFRISMHN